LFSKLFRTKVIANEEVTQSAQRKVKVSVGITVRDTKSENNFPITSVGLVIKKKLSWIFGLPQE
jgi:hypothetical protein